MKIKLKLTIFFILNLFNINIQGYVFNYPTEELPKGSYLQQQCQNCIYSKDKNELKCDCTYWDSSERDHVTKTSSLKIYPGEYYRDISVFKAQLIKSN